MTGSAEPARLVTLAEVANRLQVQVRTVRAWRQRGAGPRFFMADGRLVTTERDLNSWLGVREAPSQDRGSEDALRAPVT